MPDFIPGLQLANHFFTEVVQPILKRDYPSLQYTAALIGTGSEILSFDNAMSSDHHWGPRVMLFLSPEDFALHRAALHEHFRHHLPYTFRGYPTNFSAPDPADNGTQLLKETQSGPVNHRIEIFSIPSFFHSYLDIDPSSAFDPADWLTFPQQKLRTITAGALFHDDLNLAAIRQKFTWYPRDIWLYLLASEWSRIDQEEPFVGRTSSVGDELGSQILAARLVQHVMRLCFLMERQYAPYSKWFGTAFSKLSCAAELTPILQSALTATSFPQRERFLCNAYEFLAEMHNRLHITPPLPTNVSNFHGRPFLVIHAGLFVQAIKAQIQDATVRRIAEHSKNIGSIDVFSDSTDLLEATHLRRQLRLLYAELSPAASSTPDFPHQ